MEKGKAAFSAYLDEITPALRVLVNCLCEQYEYVSLLASDSRGFTIQCGQHTKSISTQTLTTERGFVVRVMRNGLYSEYAFSAFDPEHPEITAEAAISALDAQLSLIRTMNMPVYDTAVLPDEELTLLSEAEAEMLPEDTDMSLLMNQFKAISDRAMEEGENGVDCIVQGRSTHISKLFLTKNRFLRQSYVQSEGVIMFISNSEGKSDRAYEGISGRCGPELYRELDELLPRVLRASHDLQHSERIQPGSYDVITSPEVTGLIAHEAFGHGVEMDMFVKGRALGAEYLGKTVASPLVTMHEGANCVVDVASYAFDDEGILAGDVTEIDHGILQTGICDALSALRLGIAPTGNGKRENYRHKVYTRMTNTMFDSGENTLDEMIQSIEYGYLLEGMQSGMEDPKHWGIQCIIDRGYEIQNGKLTGRVVSPVVMTGYVPDLLKSISMVSQDRQSFGSGACGKGHKEWVKVSDGGPYLKAKARLG